MYVTRRRGEGSDILIFRSDILFAWPLCFLEFILVKSRKYRSLKKFLNYFFQKNVHTHTFATDVKSESGNPWNSQNIAKQLFLVYSWSIMTPVSIHGHFHTHIPIPKHTQTRTHKHPPTHARKQPCPHKQTKQVVSIAMRARDLKGSGSSRYDLEPETLHISSRGK